MNRTEKRERGIRDKLVFAAVSIFSSSPRQRKKERERGKSYSDLMKEELSGISTNRSLFLSSARASKPAARALNRCSPFNEHSSLYSPLLSAQNYASFIRRAAFNDIAIRSSDEMLRANEVCVCVCV